MAAIGIGSGQTLTLQHDTLPFNGNVCVLPGGTLNVNEAMGAQSVLIDDGGTVNFNVPMSEDPGTIQILSGTLNLPSPQFMAPTTNIQASPAAKITLDPPPGSPSAVSEQNGILHLTFGHHASIALDFKPTTGNLNNWYYDTQGKLPSIIYDPIPAHVHVPAYLTPL